MESREEGFIDGGDITDMHLSAAGKIQFYSRDRDKELE